MVLSPVKTPPLRSLRKTRGVTKGEDGSSITASATPTSPTPKSPKPSKLPASSKKKGKKTGNGNGATPRTSTRKAAAKAKSPPHAVEEENLQYHEPIKKLVKPNRQLDLTDDERVEEIQRVLTGDDPNLPRNVCKYSYKDRCFKQAPPGQSDHMAVHFSSEGTSLHIESRDYQVQKESEEKKREAKAEAREKEDDRPTQGNEAAEKDIGGDNDDGTDQEGSTTSTTGITATTTTSTDPDIDDNKNQFNYSERATQSFNNPTRSREVNTEPPPVTQYSENVSQWQIYDSYMSDALIGRMETKEGGDGGAGISFEDRLSVILEDDGTKSSNDPMHGENMAKLLKITERLVNQNSEDEIFHDFKYFEDKSDKFRQFEGTLLPLWKFSTDQSKRKQATSICWNPRYPDLFAVGYGSFDFSKQESGLICLYSLKNTSYPEYAFRAESGVVCLDFHPQYPSLLAAGCYDGSVMVFDIASGKKTPIYSSSVRTGEHTDPVWQVQWQCEDYGKERTFYSVSSDGRVAKWHMSNDELKMELVMLLKQTDSSLTTRSDKDTATSSGTAMSDDEDNAAAVMPVEVAAGSSLASGCCFDFNKSNSHLYIVGTEEGVVNKYSKAYGGQHLQRYVGHVMTVYAVRWSPFHEKIFLTCSADWTVKLWNHDVSEPIMSLDLGCSVSSICWSPYSSTVFAAVTSDGKCHVFDLVDNKMEALSAQKITKKARLTSVRFNTKDPILLISDERGVTHTLKLSPNLRKDCDPPEDKNIGNEEWQRARMEALLSVSAGEQVK